MWLPPYSPLRPAAGCTPVPLSKYLTAPGYRLHLWLLFFRVRVFFSCCLEWFDGLNPGGAEQDRFFRYRLNLRQEAGCGPANREADLLIWKNPSEGRRYLSCCHLILLHRARSIWYFSFFFLQPSFCPNPDKQQLQHLNSLVRWSGREMR